MKYLHKVTFLLLFIGGLNWGLLAFFNWEIGMLFGGQMAATSKVIYGLVGLSALYEAATHFKSCKECGAKPMGM